MWRKKKPQMQITLKLSITLLTHRSWFNLRWSSNWWVSRSFSVLESQSVFCQLSLQCFVFSFTESMNLVSPDLPNGEWSLLHMVGQKQMKDGLLWISDVERFGRTLDLCTRRVDVPDKQNRMIVSLARNKVVDKLPLGILPTAWKSFWTSAQEHERRFSQIVYTKNILSSSTLGKQILAR